MDERTEIDQKRRNTMIVIIGQIEFVNLREHYLGYSVGLIGYRYQETDFNRLTNCQFSGIESLLFSQVNKAYH